MKSDEGFSNMLDKQMLNQQVHENVRLISTFKNSKRGSFYCPFFMSALKPFAMSLQCLNNVLIFAEIPFL